MTVLMDFQDRAIRLTKERQGHIASFEDPEQWTREIVETLRFPYSTSEAFQHPTQRLFYRIYSRYADGDRRFYVLVRVQGYDMLVVNAFFGNGLTWGDA